jgi:hypothetical protein
MSAAELITRCSREGVALFLNERGAVGFRSARTVPLELLSQARQAKAPIAAALPALLADPAAPCPICAGGSFWRLSGVAGPAGPWVCRACVPAPSGEWTDGTALPASQAAETVAAPPAPPLQASPEASVRAIETPAPARPPARSPEAARALIREAVLRAIANADPADPCPQCGGVEWWRMRGDAGNTCSWMCGTCDPPHAELELSNYHPTTADPAEISSPVKQRNSV